MKKRMPGLLLILSITLFFSIFMSPLFRLLTDMVAFTGGYRVIDNFITPLEVTGVLAVLHILKIEAIGSQSIISTVKDGAWQGFMINWNCTGWQSLLMLLISFIALLQFEGMAYKKAIVIAAGIIWIYITNIMRITLEISIFHKAGLTPALIFHDYFAKAFIILMFAIFWMITYSLVFKGETKNTQQLIGEY